MKPCTQFQEKKLFPEKSFPSEVGGNLAPFLRFPLDDGNGHGVRAQPLLGTADDLVELLGLGRVFEFRLALLL